MIILLSINSAFADQGGMIDLTDIEEYKEINNLERLEYNSDETEVERIEAISEVAYLLGVQTSVSYRYKKITEQLENIAFKLDDLTNIKALMLDDFVVPPVMSVIDGATKLINSKRIVQTDKSFKILKPSKMVLRPPTWRDYLLYMPKPIDKPHPAVLPENLKEKATWQKYLKKGWMDGQDHANNLFKLRWKKFLTDYKGMITYHLLATQKIISSPNVNTSTDAVYLSDDGKELEINKKIWHIAKPMGFAEERNWKVIVSSRRKNHE